MGKSYRDLVVWQKAMSLVASVYKDTRSFPREEIFGFVSQMRRAALSVPCNIAEGQGRLTKKEFHQFLGIARGSLMELETQILLAQELGYLGKTTAEGLLELTNEVGRMLNGLLQSIHNG